MNGPAQFLPFALPDIGEDEINEVVDSMRSGWLTTGPKTARFEKGFAEFLGGDVEALAVNSATSGLHLALESVGVHAGDEVITTPYTFAATAEVIRYLDADPVFVDIDPVTFNIDPAAIEDAITPRTRAILPVHFAGLACDMESILSIARRHGLKVVEDAAHALPSTCNGKMIGTLDSDATVFSFYVTKTLAVGEGGMVVARNPDTLKRCSIMRLHGIDRDAFKRYTSIEPAWYYEIVALGCKYNMTDIAASMGIHQLRKVRSFQARRQQIAEYYNSEFADLPVDLPPSAPPGESHAWHLYVLRIRDDARLDRDSFIDEMAWMGIGTSVHFIPLHIHPYWRDNLSLKPEDYPIAYKTYSRAVSLPIYTKMTDAEVEHVAVTVCALLG